MFFYTDIYHVNLPAGHKFPMSKYGRVRGGLLGRGIVAADMMEAAKPIAIEQLFTVHDEEYVRQAVACALPPPMIRRIGFPWDSTHLKRSLASVGGTFSAMKSAVEHGFGACLAGGTHHAGRDFGEGFCVFNDLAVAAAGFLSQSSEKGKVAVLDADVHHGNGTAHIFGNSSEVIIADVYSQENYPKEKIPVHCPFPLAPKADDRVYLKAIEEALAALERHTPAVLLYQAGVDVLAADSLGYFSVSQEGLARREATVATFCKEKSIPLVLTLGGGYSVPLDFTIKAHIQTVEVLLQTLQR